MIKYFWNLLIAVDQFVNTLFFGDPDETISSRVGRYKGMHMGEIPKWNLLARFIDWLTDVFEDKHVEKSIESDEGVNDLFFERLK